MIEFFDFILSDSLYLVLFLVLVVLILLIPLIIKIYVLVKLSQIAKNSKIILCELQRLDSSSSQNVIQKQEEYL